LTGEQIISELVEAGGEKLSDNSVCLLTNEGAFYFRVFNNFLTAIHCIIPTDHPSQGVQIFHYYIIERIQSLKDLFLNFDRTVERIRFLVKI